MTLPSKQARAAPWIVSIDIPYPDNFMLVSHLSKLNTEENDDTLAVILSPRPLCLKAVPYGHKYHQILQAVNWASSYEEGCKEFPTGFRRMAMHLDAETYVKADWIHKLPQKYKVWFYPDPDITNKSVKEDTEFYVRFSALRLREYLDAQGIGRDEYMIYWDPESMFKTRPVLRHAFHVPDFTFGFDPSDTRKYLDLVNEHISAVEEYNGPLLSDKLREETLSLINSYIQKHDDSESHGLSVLKLDDLIVANREEYLDADMFVSGSFTEALKCVSNGFIDRVVGMGGAFDNAANILPSQYKFYVDAHAVREMIDLAKNHAEDLILITTDVVKDQHFNLKITELDECMSAFPASLNLISQYLNTSHFNHGEYCPSGMILGLIESHPHFFTTKRANISDEESMLLKYQENDKVRCFHRNEKVDNLHSEYIAALKESLRPRLKLSAVPKEVCNPHGRKSNRKVPRIVIQDF